MRWSILKVSSCVLTVCSLISGSFYFYTDSQWLQASPNIRFDLLFSLQFSITITICLILILTENNYMPFGYVRRTIVLLRFLSLLIILCFLYSLQQLVSIVLWTIGYSRSGSIGDRLVVYIALWVLTLTTTGSSAFMVIKLAQGNELNFTEICIKKKDYDEKQVRRTWTNLFEVMAKTPLKASSQFSDSFSSLKHSLRESVIRKLTMFFLKKCFPSTVAENCQPQLFKTDRLCMWCNQHVHKSTGYARVTPKKELKLGHWDCLSRLAIQRPNGRCEISDAVSELRNLGAPVTHEERDALLRTLLT